MSRDESAYVADMLEACARVTEYTSGLDATALRDTFAAHGTVVEVNDLVRKFGDFTPTLETLERAHDRALGALIQRYG